MSELDLVSLDGLSLEEEVDDLQGGEEKEEGEDDTISLSSLTTIPCPSPEPARNVSPPPAYLLRLMEDHARKLRRNAPSPPAPSTSFVLPSLTGSATKSTNTSGSPSRSASYNSSSSSSNLADVSPGAFTLYSGSSSSSSRGSEGSSSTLPSLNLVPALSVPFSLPNASLHLAQVISPEVGGTSSSSSTNTDRTIVPSPPPAQHSYAPSTRLEDVYNLPRELGPEEDLLPPENFAMVTSFVYRSSFPKRKNFPFLQSLGLKSVLTLILEDYPEQNLEFLQTEGIKFFQFGIPGNKVSFLLEHSEQGADLAVFYQQEPFIQIPDDKIVAALAVIMDARNHPMLIHCNKGKHRTGCLIGCLRKVQQWSHTAIFDEYRRYSFPKSRSMDQQYIEAFDGLQAIWQSVDARYLPSWALPNSNG